MMKILTLVAIWLVVLAAMARAQEKPDAKIKETTPRTVKKANQRPIVESPKTVLSEPFAKASVETMAAQCVKIETEAGNIELEMFPESAPESVRSFLNLAATGVFDSTTFSRIVKGFIVQGGDLFTRKEITPEIDKRARQTLPDEPNSIKHERGIVSMARANEPNSASTNFFILVGEARHLDGVFAAFGRVTSGMETVDVINKMPVEGEKPTKPIRLNRVTVTSCQAQLKP